MRLYVLCFAAGIWWLQNQSRLPDFQPYWLALVAVLAALLVARHLRWPAVRYVLIAAMFAASGVLWAGWMAQQRLADALPADWEGRDIELVGVVANMPQPYERSLRFEFDVERVITAQATVPGHLALSWWGTLPGGARPASLPSLHAGERWALTVRLKRPHGNLNPHGFDYEAWLLERGIRATGYVRAGPADVRLSEGVMQPRYLIERAREAIRDRIHGVLPDAPYVGVLAALAIGDERAIPPSQWQVYTRTGVNHLMSISGLHVTMLSGLGFALVYFLWRRSARLTLWLPARKAAAIAGVSVALLYAWLAGYAVPAQRTVYMLAVVAVALWMGRLTSASVVLSGALFAVLVIDPWAVLAPGFWLSFGAVAVILFVSTGRIAPSHWLQATLRVQWAVTIGLVPLLLAMFQQVSLISPLANAFAIPVVSWIVVPLTLAGVIPGLGLLLQLAHAVMESCGNLLEWMSALPAAVWQQHAPMTWTVVVAVAGIAWLLLPRGFPARWVGGVALLPLFLVRLPAPAEGAFALTVLDVGEGLAVVVRTSTHALLYDTGPAFGPQVDSGNRVIVPYLRAAGVSALDAMVVSHDDSDHSGGAVSVLQAMPVVMLWSSLADAQPLAAHAGSAQRCVAGARWRWDGIDFEFLHPRPERYEDQKLRGNDRSCVLRVASAQASVLLTADIQKKSERELLAGAQDRLRSQIMVVPHHGSGTSSGEEFVERVNPDIALVTAGYRNRFGHPKEEVLDRYRALGSRIYRTDLEGALMLTAAADGRVDVARYRSIYQRYWHAPSSHWDRYDEDEPQ